MSSRSRVTVAIHAAAALLMAGSSLSALAGQIDIVGPPGSGRFGSQVLALPNGNFAVSDPYTADWSPTPGAVYLYSADGKLISTLTGSEPGDYVGSELKSLGNGNFVVISPSWHHGRGAVTFVNGTTGLAGTVSANNSLVGSQVGDNVGYSYIESAWEPPPLRSFWVVGGSNYVVTSNHWSDGGKLAVGAVTWCSGTSGCTGPVSSANSLIGGTAYDLVGEPGIEVLRNGNYVVLNDGWDNPGVAADAGAATWASGSSGRAGVVSPTNSLVGSKTYDMSGAYVVPLQNGNYVVAAPGWTRGTSTAAGAVVWGNGTTGIAGPISTANAFVGSNSFDRVGYSVTALSNGHYVMCSPYLDAGPITDIGFARWANGNTGLVEMASAFLSLIGPGSGKGPDHAIALANGNYVVVSPNWDAGGAPNLGAVTWLDGSAGTWASVSAANSLVGSSANDHIGTNVVALSNGNYVVGSPQWDGVAEDTGAATWANGSMGLVGVVSAANSLVGSTASDGMYGVNITALSNGNYVVLNQYWDNGGAIDAGAATWGNGATGTVGVVSATNSLVGANEHDHVGECWATALSNGNYVVCSDSVDLAGHTNNGAITWGDGTSGIVGTVSTSNSLYGSANSDLLGAYGMRAMSDGSYVINNGSWNQGLGAITLSNGTAPLVGLITPSNSVLGTDNHWSGMSYDYDAIHHRLAVGRQDSNIVSLFTLDADAVFADGFEG